MPKTPNRPARDLAAFPAGSMVMAREPHRHNHRIAIIASGRIWWDRRGYDSASAACRAMRGDDTKQINGWRELGVLTDEGFVSLADAYDQRIFTPTAPMTRAQLRDYIGDVNPEHLGLTPREP